MTIKKLEEIVSCDQITKKGNLVTFRQGFYYRHGKTASDFLQKVENALVAAGVNYATKEWDQVDLPFRGSKGTAQNSHWFVKIELLENN